MSDVALRKKKNADAQAAFRARRANYIATLEETVTSLESVVLQLQDSCRETRNEVQELRHENGRLRHEFREREKFWRALWQARKTSHGPESDDLPPFPASVSSSQAQNGHIHQYGGASLTYRINDDPSLCNSSYNAGPSHYPHSPSVSYAGVDTDPSNDNSLNSVSHRGAKYSPYPYSVQGIPREGPWGQTMGLSTSSGGDSGAATSSHSSHSPGQAETPGVTSPEMSYVARFPVEDQKVSLSNLDTAPYVFPSRSLSPATSTPGSSSSTPITTSSTSMTSFPFTFPDAAAQERADFDYRRHAHPPGTEVTLHGGTADISLPCSQSDALRYRLPTRSSNSSDRLHPALPHFSANDIGSPHERGSSDGDTTLYPHPRLRPRRGNAHPRSSRSPSPSAPNLSGTLAVIKAQAFGALRRTRARTKKSSEGAAKVAMDVLEARGIGMGVSTGSKRPRLHDDDLDMSDT